MNNAQQRPLTAYETRLKNWEIGKNKDCPNYTQARAWAEKHGFRLSKDVSYNGFIYLEKTICETEDPHDGYQLELQVYDGTTDEKWHNLQQYDMEADFGGIFDETKYRYKMAHGLEKNKDSQSLDELFEFTLQREATLIAEHNELVKHREEREVLWKKNPELKEQWTENILASLRKR